ncbi:PepSY domain-containing protein [Flavobacterium sp. MXW15]|uniref:PepSY domain-containing protein n=1 Tax=Xanthomonas chitinilytica TaxID=2989819 RepID=A0ABT3JRR7_9XANT|nr:PepSY-associated TM helix domain-containing protein [Xanthomonas sp. H13-6]MCW4453776.1 PepSY domain-containing protein [Flavobacterium sp. MXW15]MCW4471176.1 PepSY domain-containing protein [Xanthomonas sp. H13-6]
MKNGFRQSMAWLHTWTGLLVGWLLLLIFMAGTASYYREEISRWMRPELPRTTVASEVAAERAVAFLQRKAPQAELWSVTLPDPRNPAMRMFWRNPESMVQPPPEGGKRRRRGGGRFGDATLDPSTGQEISARETRGGDFFYRLHFDLHYIPVLWARYIVGFCAMFMLVAIITGVITHKKIFKDFFTFRPEKGLRSWLDFHNVSAVMALPYHAMITYTGIVTLMFMYLPWGVKAAYPNDEDAFFNEAFGGMAEVREAAPGSAAPLPVRQLLDSARAQWRGAEIAGFSVHHPGNANAAIDIRQRDGRRLSIDTPALRYDAVSGELLERSPAPGGASQTRGVMYGLHLARFADWGLRALFFVSGLVGCLMVASGVVLWAVKERPKHAKSGRTGFGLRLVDALNIGAVAGLPIAFAAYFWGNRLLPVGMAGRAAAEADVFFYAWAAALLAAFAWPKRMMWAWQLYLGAVLFALIPLLNALTTHAHLGVTLASGDWVLAGFDLSMVAFGACLAVCGWRMQRWQPPLSAAEKKRRQQAAATPPVGAGEAA